jgi:hypothetical protein
MAAKRKLSGVDDDDDAAPLKSGKHKGDQTSAVHQSKLSAVVKAMFINAYQNASYQRHDPEDLNLSPLFVQSLLHIVSLMHAAVVQSSSEAGDDDMAGAAGFEPSVAKAARRLFTGKLRECVLAEAVRFSTDHVEKAADGASGAEDIGQQLLLSLSECLQLPAHSPVLLALTGMVQFIFDDMLSIAVH